MPDIIEPYWMSYHPKTEILEKGFEHKILNDETMKLINCGLKHSYFESSLASEDFHNEYYFILKVFPALPVFLRKKLTYHSSRKIPYPAKIILYVYSIFYLAYKHKSPRIKLFLTYYTKQMVWLFKLKLFNKRCMR